MAEIKHDNRLYALEQVCVCPCLCYSVTKSVIVSLLYACVREMNISYRHMHACKHASVCVRVCVCVCVCVMRVFLCVHMLYGNLHICHILLDRLQLTNIHRHSRTIIHLQAKHSEQLNVKLDLLLGRKL
jgi:hypothetical protein